MRREAERSCRKLDWEVQIMMRVEGAEGVAVRKWRKSMRELGRYAIGWVGVAVVCFMLGS